MVGGPEGCGWMVEPVHQGRDEAIFAVALQALLLEPLRVMEHLKGVGLDRGKVGDGT